MRLKCKMLKTSILSFILIIGLGLSSQISAQQRSIQGEVVDTEGDSLPGVTVVVKGTTIGTVTDGNGNFSLQVPPDSETLVFSFVGLKTQEIPIESKTNFSITMEQESIGLEEVVAVGYGTKKRGSITGAISDVGNEEIIERPVRRLDQALTGKVAGMTITDRGGIPGSPNGQFQIRNFGNPLIIVDGMEQSFNFMDPQEIESITVLKDASAAVYGTRAGNGVVLVTTKRGSEQKPKLKVNSSYTISQPTVYLPFADAATYTTLRNYALVHAGNEPIWTEEEIEKYRDGSDPRYPNTDWWGETFKNWAPMKDFKISANGGNNSVKYFISFGARDEGSLLESEAINFNKYNLRSNIDIQFTKNLKGSFDLSSRFENREQPGVTFGALGAGIMQSIIRALPIYPVQYPDENKPPYTGETSFNPVYLSQQEWSGYQKDKFKSIRSAITLNYDLSHFIQGFSTEFRFDYRLNDTFFKDWLTAYDTYLYDYDTDKYEVSGDRFNNGKTTLKEQYNRTWDYFLNYKVNYDRTFNNIHRISGLLLYEAIESSHDRFNAYREGFISNAVDQMFAGGDVNKDNYGTANEDGRKSIVGRLNYSFRDKYLAEFLFRYDASPKFHPDYRWGFFPGVSLGWMLSEENFLKDKKAVDHLRLRVSRGQTGLEGGVNYNYLSGYNFSGSYIFQEGLVEKGLAPSGITNIEATWATNTISNAGIDGSFWDGKLSFETNVFYRKKEDILTSRAQSVPSTFGAILPEENLNSQDTRGWELELTHKNSIGNFRYQLFGNVSWARSKWIHFDEPEYTDEDEIYRYKRSGQWTNVTYGYLTDGLFESEEEIAGWADITNGADNANILPGDIKFLDLNDDGVINWKDQRIIGKSSLPTTNFAFGGNASLKGVSLNVLFTGATGFSKYYDNQFIVPFGLDYNCFQFFEDAWTIDNQDPNAPYPRLRLENQGGHPNTSYNSDFWILENAYYIRLKELQLSYNFSNDLLSSLNIDQLRMYVMGYNLGFISNVKVDDPENSTPHGRYYPQQRSFSIGIDVTF